MAVDGWEEERIHGPLVEFAYNFDMYKHAFILLSFVNQFVRRTVGGEIGAMV